MAIPFCGADEVGPALSDKNRFSSFFRMTSGGGFGRNLAQLLQFWNVKRVAVVLGGAAVAPEIRTALNEAGITIAIMLFIKQGMLMPDLIPYYQGLVWAFPDYLDFSTPPIQRFKNSWDPLTAKDPRKYPPFEDITFWYTQSYDCVKLMMQGLHNFLRDNPQYTPEMLANGSLNKYLTPDKFANTGYEGVSYNPITLNKYGDLNL
ncbi:hypothetical protein HDU76_008147, partial [Blyttiomyces sp. JEL0837]